MGREHWVEISFNDIIEVLESGSRPKGGVKGIDKGVPSIGAEHLNVDGGFEFSNIRYIPLDYANKMNHGKIRQNDILIVKDGATTGKVSIVNKDFPFNYAFINEHVFLCRLFDFLNHKFYFQYLRCHDGQKQIMSSFHGGAQGGINSEFIYTVTIPLPPLNEQKRIVERLDALLPKVGNTKKRLEKLSVTLRKFRQSVLAAACSGRLTEDWREDNPIVNQYNGPIVDDAIYELPDDWVWAELRNLADGFQYGTSLKSENEGEVPVLRMGNLQKGMIDWKDLKYTDNDSEVKKYKLNYGDVLFNRTNSPDLVGKTSIYKDSRLAIFAGYLIRIKYIKRYINSDYLNYCLNTERAREWCKQVKTDGVSQSNINAQVLATFLIPLPSLEEQQEIVRRVDTLFTLADSLEAKCKDALGQVDKIEQSILAKAFRGGLVEPDPNDEPAEDLLRRILDEKEKLSRARKSKKSRS